MTNPTPDHLSTALRQIRDSGISPGQRWLHQGSVYEIVTLALLEATVAPMVVYRNVLDVVVWVRPLEEFKERFVRERIAGYATKGSGV